MYSTQQNENIGLFFTQNKKISDGVEEELNSISWETSESSHNKTQTFLYIGKHMCFAASSG